MPDAIPTPGLTFLLAAWPILAAVMLLLWWRMLRTADATSVDVAWSFGVGAAGLVAIGLGGGSSLQRGLAAAVLLLWSGRLGLHLLRDRVWSGRGEDGRYRALRMRMGARWRVGFFWVYQAQAVAVLPFVLPYLLWARNAEPGLGAVQLLGMLAAASGLAFERIADSQLARHRADPGNRGRTCRAGLWGWSRHPNYFGEWVHWCGIALLALPAPQGWLALLTPVVLFLLLHAVSGIPHVERQALASRGEDYRRYQRETNRFFPWFPRSAVKEATS